MRLVIQLVAVVAVTFAGSLAVGAVQGHAPASLVVDLLTAALLVFVYARVVRWTERRAAVEVAVRGAARALLRGALGGIALFAAVIGAIALGGGYRVEGTGSVAGAMGIAGLMIVVAVWEELVFRGVLFRIAEERLGTWVAMALTGLLFGLIHLPNQDASLWGALCVAIEAGGMLAAAYVATRNLWVPIGLHFGWNYAAGGIFGTVVSGNGESQGLLDGVTSGPALLTGGDFGPEGSVYAVAFCLMVTVGFMWLAYRRGQVVPRTRRARGGEAAIVAQ